MSALDNIMAKDADMAWRRIDDEILVVNPKDSLIYPLEDTAARVWELIDGTKTSREIADVIYREFESDKNTIEKDVASFIEELSDAGLIKKCA